MSKDNKCLKLECNGDSNTMGFCSAKHFNINLWLKYTEEGN